MKFKSRVWPLAALLCFLMSAGTARADAQDRTAAILGAFAKQWPDRRTPYRTPGDQSWKIYALAMKSLVAMGPKAVPGLMKALSHRSFQVRALSARVLGFLGAKQAVPRLIELLKDPSAPVALLAADALGQIRTPQALAALKEAKTTGNKGDVLLHVSKALERKVPLENDVVAQILKIDAKNIDTARVGALAPDFTLRLSDGKPWKLSAARGKRAVVLIFLYGDG